jgi:hypothetical protein
MLTAEGGRSEVPYTLAIVSSVLEGQPIPRLRHALVPSLSFNRSLARNLVVLASDQRPMLDSDRQRRHHRPSRAASCRKGAAGHADDLRPVIPAWVSNAFVSIVEQARGQHLYAEQLIERARHCAISPDEVARGFASLRAWIDTGVTPKTGCVQ